MGTIEEGTKTKNSVTALFARTDISEGSYILPSSMATSFILNGNSLSNLQNNLKIDGTGDMTVIGNFLSYVDDYGHESMSEGSEISIVEVGASQWMVRNENKSEVMLDDGCRTIHLAKSRSSHLFMIVICCLL